MVVEKSKKEKKVQLLENACTAGIERKNFSFDMGNSREFSTQAENFFL